MLDLPETVSQKTPCTGAASPEKGESSATSHIYEKQRDYYFGSEAQVAKDSFEVQECPDGGLKSSILSQESCSSQLIESDGSTYGIKMPVVALNASIATNQPLDSIVELNYEASSDEEDLIGAQ